jgi:DNA-binding PadR family transcriptional regulator
MLLAVSVASPEACMNSILEFVEDRTGDVIDNAQLYIALKKFVKKGWIKSKGKIPSKSGGKMMNAYAITPSGRDLLLSKRAHMKRLLSI